MVTLIVFFAILLVAGFIYWDNYAKILKKQAELLSKIEAGDTSDASQELLYCLSELDNSQRVTYSPYEKVLVTQSQTRYMTDPEVSWTDFALYTNKFSKIKLNGPHEWKILQKAVLRRVR